MKIIDAHIHLSHIASFADCAKRTSFTDYSIPGYIDEAGANGVVGAVCMGLTESAPAGFPSAGAPTPMLADMSYTLPPGISLCLGVNPHTLDKRSLERLECMIKESNRVVGMKIYAGYYHFDVSDPVYSPLYELAAKHDLAVVVHTGDTYSDRGLLKYAHPLCIDELAVSHPDMRIIICHMGVPWVFDACEVAAKNKNVYLDISGMLIGSAEYIGAQAKIPLLVDRYRQALVFLDEYDKILYGSDWPLVPMGAYIDFCKQLIPPEAYDKVFYQNAANVFKLPL